MIHAEQSNQGSWRSAVKVLDTCRIALRLRYPAGSAVGAE